MIHFRLDKGSGVPAYRQIIDQVRNAVYLGILRPGDQLPTVREVVKQITINPNTVHRAYLELEIQGLTEGRTGSGTYIRQSLSEVSDEQPRLLAQLEAWIDSARHAGLGPRAIEALIAQAINSMKEEGQQ
jgi:GntR family transcriptional regulator